MNTMLSRLIAPLVATAATTSLQRSSFPTSSCEDAVSAKQRPRLIFLGSGSSTGCPKPICALLFQDNNVNPSLKSLREEFAPHCRVSNVAIQGDPRQNKDYRNNPSLLISHYEKGICKNVVIDVGKTFRETALRWMPMHGIDSLDAIILTHHHMDAVGGLDDVRGFQKVVKLNEFMKDKQLAPTPVRVPIQVFMSKECLDQVSSQFPWLFPKEQAAAVDKAKPVVQRDVAALDVHIIENFQPFDAEGLRVVPLPVWHGDDLESLGFAFSVRGEDGSHRHILYISDISRMMPETMKYIQRNMPQIDIFIVDALLPERPHPVHYNLKQAIALSQKLKAKQTYLVGMSCDAFPPHDEMNSRLSKEEQHVQLAHDGLVIHL